MRDIDVKQIEEAVKRLFLKANYTLPEDTVNLIGEAQNKESDLLAKSILGKLCENLAAAKEINVPICQDTGMAVVFAEVGCDCHIVGGTLREAVDRGVRDAYRDGYMRKSVVGDPLFGRKNTEDNTPCVLHTELISGDRIKLTAAPKGFGSENMSALRMFNPSATKEDIIGFVVETVKNAGGKPCPPVVVGVGIGGTFDYAAYLAKKALLRNVSERNKNENYASLELEILEGLNRLGIGPQGLGGDTTALAVNVEYYPTHIAGLPVAVNINCHVARHTTEMI